MKRLLVIRFSALGDVAMLAPVVRATAEVYPEVEITVLSQVRMADLFAQMPANVIFHGVDVGRQSLREIASGLGRFDYVADMHDVWRSRYIRAVLRLRGASVSTIHKGRFERFLLTHRIRREALKHMTSRYLDVLEEFGLYRRDTDEIPTKSPSGGIKKGIGVAPFAAHKGKIYPLEKMEEVVRMLSGRGEDITLFGSKTEAAVLDEWAKKYPNVASIAGRKSLGEELEIIRTLRVMVSMDSANMHLASLVGTRVISIWGATHPNAGFTGICQKESDCIQRDLACRPCSIYGKRKCKYGDYRCLDIEPEVIVNKVTASDEDCH